MSHEDTRSQIAAARDNRTIDSNNRLETKMLNTTRTTKTSYCNVTVRRPNGEVETIRHPSISKMNDRVWAQMKQAMTKAKKGECLSYENLTESKERELTLEEQRKDLFQQLECAIDKEREAMNRAVHTSVMRSGYQGLVDNIKTIEGEIAQFDAEHPEILEAIKKANHEEALRHMWD
jgi:hypothetical protein